MISVQQAVATLRSYSASCTTTFKKADDLNYRSVKQDRKKRFRLSVTFAKVVFYAFLANFVALS